MLTKTEIIQIRCEPVVKRALLLIANHDRRKPPEALREVIREAAISRGVWPPKGHGLSQEVRHATSS